MGKKWAIVLAGGQGKRAGGGVPKQYKVIGDRPVLYYSLKAFTDAGVDGILVAADSEHMQLVMGMIDDFALDKVCTIFEGGEERLFSVARGLNELEGLRDNEGNLLAGEDDIVLIHDGVRPFAAPELINETAEAAALTGAAIAAMRSRDSIKISDEEGNILAAPARELVWQAQTPQAFKLGEISHAYKKVLRSDEIPAFTDDAGVYKYVFPKNAVRLVESPATNMKITTPEDFAIAEALAKSMSLEERKA